MNSYCIKCNKPLTPGISCDCNKPNVWLKAREKDDHKKLMKVYYAANYQKKKKLAQLNSKVN